jgi:hypothetical protein
MVPAKVLLAALAPVPSVLVSPDPPKLATFAILVYGPNGVELVLPNWELEFAFRAADMPEFFAALVVSFSRTVSVSPTLRARRSSNRGR